MIYFPTIYKDYCYLPFMKKISFNESCYALLRKVPSGKVTTYQELTRAMKTKAYRAVGNAMHRNPYGFLCPVKSTNAKDFPVNKNPYAPEVPCHRVVRSDGDIGGFAFGSNKKIKMLRSEGVEIVDGKIDLNKYLFRFI